MGSEQHKAVGEQMQEFSFGGSSICGMVDEHGEAWFIAQDVADVLGHRNIRRLMQLILDEDEKKYHDCYTQRYKHRNLLCITESGVYGLIFASRVEKAKEFKRWLRKEVLPSLRKTGIYITNEETQPQLMVDLLEPKRQGLKQKFTIDKSTSLFNMVHEFDLHPSRAEQRYLHQRCKFIAELWGLSREYTIDKWRGRVRAYPPEVIYQALAEHMD